MVLKRFKIFGFYYSLSLFTITIYSHCSSTNFVLILYFYYPCLMDDSIYKTLLCTCRTHTHKDTHSRELTFSFHLYSLSHSSYSSIVISPISYFDFPLISFYFCKFKFQIIFSVQFIQVYFQINTCLFSIIFILLFAYCQIGRFYCFPSINCILYLHTARLDGSTTFFYITAT